MLDKKIKPMKLFDWLKKHDGKMVKILITNENAFLIKQVPGSNIPEEIYLIATAEEEEK